MILFRSGYFYGLKTFINIKTICEYYIWKKKLLMYKFKVRIIVQDDVHSDTQI